MKRKKGERGWDESEEIKWQKCQLHWGWHVPRISRSINHVRVVLAYISRRQVGESIRWLCLKSIFLKGRGIY